MHLLANLSIFSRAEQSQKTVFVDKSIQSRISQFHAIKKSSMSAVEVTKTTMYTYMRIILKYMPYFYL